MSNRFDLSPGIHLDTANGKIDKQNKRLILASNSPRRKDLLLMLGLDFEVKIADIDEAPIFTQHLDHLDSENKALQVAYATRAVAIQKARTVLEIDLQEKDCIVLAADTVVYDGEVLGKPVDEADSFAILKRLSGQTHLVITAVALVSKEGIEAFTSVTEVRFHPWDEKQKAIVKEYIALGLTKDKAGAYGIQEFGSLLVERIHGDYYTVVGLPLSEVYRRLQ